MKKHSYSDTKGPSTWYKMKKRPKHLPSHKINALNEIVGAILSCCPVEMIILFGSYARGDWVEDEYEEDYVTYEYRSDYDILIVTADKTTERDVNYDNALKEALSVCQNGARVNYIVHTIAHVNQMLAERRFFFMDILKEGYLLHDTGRYKLARPPKALPPKLMLKHAQEYFEEWMDSADGFFEMFLAAMDMQRYKIAAFQLHQAAERYITCLLLVHTGYRPKEHDMEKLLRQVAGFDIRFADIFPNNTPDEKHLFELLRRAYVDARYSKAYTITKEELDILKGRVIKLKDIASQACKERIDKLRSEIE